MSTEKELDKKRCENAEDERKCIAKYQRFYLKCTISSLISGLLGALCGQLILHLFF